VCAHVCVCVCVCVCACVCVSVSHFVTDLPPLRREERPVRGMLSSCSASHMFRFSLRFIVSTAAHNCQRSGNLSSCGFRMADDAASEQKTVNGIVIPPANGMLERLQEVSCDKNTLPVYSVSQTDCIIHKGTISLICAFCG